MQGQKLDFCYERTVVERSRNHQNSGMKAKAGTQTSMTTKVLEKPALAVPWAKRRSEFVEVSKGCGDTPINLIMGIFKDTSKNCNF
jgi:hypothetical protein